MTGLACAAIFSAFAQMPPPTLPATARVEPGLEKAVKWKWQAVPSHPKDWGLELPDLPRPIPSAGPSPTLLTGSGADSYEVRRGDALILIAKKFGITVAQLKAFNGLTKDTILIGQILKIPTPAEAAALLPPPPAKVGLPAAKPDQDTQSDNVLLQVFLDRQQFSTGSINGVAGPMFQRVLQLYQSAHEDLKDPQMLLAKAKAVVGDPFTTYTLKPEDFRFIAPPKVEKVLPLEPSAARTKTKTKAKPAPAATPPPTFEELSAAPMLAYRTPWEFVAERFHCDETFLRSLNEKVKIAPLAGTEFVVPNVIPFEIERPLEDPIQPEPNPQAPVTAAVLDLSLIVISRGDVPVAAMPMAVARPGLRGKDSWTIFDAIPHPRLVTRQELTTPERPSSGLFMGAYPSPTPTPVKPELMPETYLAAGPNNPAGILWLKLAKADSTEPPPYGLHGTSIPDQMTTDQSIGWLRMTNWDIVRAARLLPAGTPLLWNSAATNAPAPAPVSAPVPTAPPIARPPPLVIP